VRARARGGAVHWNVTTCLSNHVGGDGSLVIYDAYQLSDPAGARCQPVARASLARAERVKLAAVVARTIVVRSDYVQETLPTSAPWAAVSTCAWTVCDTGRWSRS
jgi:hypothetical protein